MTSEQGRNSSATKSYEQETEARIARQRTITADTDLRLCRFCGLSDGWWLRLQADYDTELAKAALAKTLAKIKPWKETAEEAASTR